MTAWFVFAVILLSIGTGCVNTELKDRELILSSLDNAIADAQEEGKYKCCIDPPCTMCYLGHWRWDDGSCLCDEMLALGNLDAVCPECRNSQGSCGSQQTFN